MKIGPKFKICKRLGSAIFEKCQTQKYSVSEARSASSRGRKRGRPGNASEFKRQLIEKQKMRYSYGISERQLSKYVRESIEKVSGDPAGELMARLESRLDNVVYRMGLAKTRRLARQLVSHGHIIVNGRKVTIPSYRVKTGDVVSVREGSRTSVLFSTLTEESLERTLPVWVTFNPGEMQGGVVADPSLDTAEQVFDPVQVLEYYSR